MAPSTPHRGLRVVVGGADMMGGAVAATRGKAALYGMLAQTCCQLGTGEGDDALFLPAKAVALRGEGSILPYAGWNMSMKFEKVSARIDLMLAVAFKFMWL